MGDYALWEYRSITLGTFWSPPKDEDIEAVLNELGSDGWEVVGAFPQQNSNQFRFTLKRPIAGEPRRRRSWPG